MKKSRKPYKIKKKKPIWKTKLFWRIFISLVFFGEVFYSVYFLVPFQIKEIIILGNEKIGTAELEGFVRNKIDKRILSFQTKSIFLADPRAIEKEILTNFPKIDKANLKRRFPNSLVLKVYEREPVAVFIQGSNSFFIDKEGVVFERVSEENRLLKIGKVQDIEFLEIKLGERALEEKLMAVILEIEDKMENELKIPIEEILIFSEERLNAKTEQGWEIYFDPQKEISWQLTKLKAVLGKEIPTERQKDLEYIEIRFGNLSPYKYR